MFLKLKYHQNNLVIICRKDNFFIGSRFSQYLKSEEYQFKMINKIQIYLEQGEAIILKYLESVYPPLYNAFNQNCTVIRERNYARISIGPTIIHYSYVNDNFKCIVYLDGFERMNITEAKNHFWLKGPFCHMHEKEKIINFNILFIIL